MSETETASKTTQAKTVSESHITAKSKTVESAGVALSLVGSAWLTELAFLEELAGLLRALAPPRQQPLPVALLQAASGTRLPFLAPSQPLLLACCSKGS